MNKLLLGVQQRGMFYKCASSIIKKNIHSRTVHKTNSNDGGNPYVFQQHVAKK